MRAVHTMQTVALLLLLSACGGGGASDSAASDPAPVTPGTPATPTTPTTPTTPASPVADISTVVAMDPGSSLPANWRDGPFAEIYVRAYRDSNGDGIGDFKGLTQSLDYLKALGVTGIWLMPVTASQDRDHGYAVQDYRALETDYGSLADFDELLREAHSRGIGVIVDYVINHSAAQNPMFVNAKSGADAQFRSWYIWSSTKPTGWNIYGNNPWYAAGNAYYFAGFWDQMPDFNLRNADVMAYHQSSMRYWLNRGVDGFRFDAAGNLVENGPQAWEGQPENYTIMGNVKTMVGGYASRYMVCEAPIDPKGFSTACGSAFAFGHNYDIVSAAKGSSSAVQAVADYFKTAPAGMATMVSNHDSFAGQRLYDQVAGNLAQYRLAAATYLLQPGVPFIYYGEEIGMAGASSLSGDWKLRTPMSWTASTSNAGFTTGAPFRAVSGNVAQFNVAAQQNDTQSLLAYYTRLIALRRDEPALARGNYGDVVVNGSVMSFARRLNGTSIRVVINYGTQASSVQLGNLAANGSITPIYPAAGAAQQADAAGKLQIAAPAQSVQVFRE
ncbi:alpha-amylase family glycosyl hydrolase [Niveibacterium sp. SC-1]|uniref:alpha-amylase family glycosyl hydrolase n=1 Tax=Niveibacterium sp. SC-1 TaxID=3135646 RepID=UPI00312011CB